MPSMLQVDPCVYATINDILFILIEINYYFGKAIFSQSSWS